ncbi:hypothetical protein CDAR_68761 [Caerostris darwini]|uniref:Uncharacterized protein n=1 Tax=Caerostris darwini TaxID=1538125 RepID=A0AAV4WWN5_9ARAC|nr:hypothetical protein CDAR_68761 [Caerostris darwini]
MYGFLSRRRWTFFALVTTRQCAEVTNGKKDLRPIHSVQWCLFLEKNKQIDRKNSIRIIFLQDGAYLRLDIRRTLNCQFSNELIGKAAMFNGLGDFISLDFCLDNYHKVVFSEKMWDF